MNEAYRRAVPDLSPNRRELLFTAKTAAGGAEIRRSTNPDGQRREAGDAGLGSGLVA